MNLKDAHQTHLDFPIPEIIIRGTIDRKMYEWVTAAILYLRSKGKKEAVIVIDSSGGECSAGFDIYDTIRLSGIKFTGLVINQAGSMASIILQACEVRKCAQHAMVLIHHTKREVSHDDLVNKKRLALIQKKSKLQQKQLYSIYTLRTNKSRAEIRLQCIKDKSMNPSEALAFGLIDEIV